MISVSRRFGMRIIAAATLKLPLLAVLPAYLAAALLWTFGAVLAFTYSPLALPLIEPLLARMVSLGATTGFRFLVAPALLAQELRALSRAQRDRENGLRQ